MDGDLTSPSVRALSFNKNLGHVESTAFAFGGGWLVFPAHLLAEKEVPLFFTRSGQHIPTMPLTFVRLPNPGTTAGDALDFGDVAIVRYEKDDIYWSAFPLKETTLPRLDNVKPALVTGPPSGSTLTTYFLSGSINVTRVSKDLPDDPGWQEIVKPLLTRGGFIVSAPASAGPPFRPGASGTPVTFGGDGLNGVWVGVVVWGSADGSHGAVLDLNAELSSLKNMIDTIGLCLPQIASERPNAGCIADAKTSGSSRVIPMFSDSFSQPVGAGSDGLVKVCTQILDQICPKFDEFQGRLEYLAQEGAGLIRGLDLTSVALSLSDTTAADGSLVQSMFRLPSDVNHLIMYPHPRTQPDNWGGALLLERRSDSTLPTQRASVLACKHINAVLLQNLPKRFLPNLKKTLDRSVIKYSLSVLQEYYVRLSRHQYLSVHFHLSKKGGGLPDLTALPSNEDDVLCHDLSFRHNCVSNRDTAPGTSLHGKFWRDCYPSPPWGQMLPATPGLHFPPHTCFHDENVPGDQDAKKLSLKEIKHIPPATNGSVSGVSLAGKDNGDPSWWTKLNPPNDGSWDRMKEVLVHIISKRLAYLNGLKPVHDSSKSSWYVGKGL